MLSRIIELPHKKGNVIYSHVCEVTFLRMDTVMLKT